MFITFEGIEGVGKTTQLAFAVDRLKKAGVSVVATREPGGTGVAEEIRSMLLKHRQEEAIHPLTELLLMFAARVQHVENIIRPSLKKGNWVICDRFTDATYAYQGGGRGMAVQTIEQLEKLILGSFKPDLTFLLDAPPHLSLKRVQRRTGGPDRFELEKQTFFEQVRAQYHWRVKQDPQRFVVIDATLALDQVRAAIEKILLELLAKEKT